MFIVPMSNINPIQTFENANKPISAASSATGFAGILKDAVETAREAQAVSDKDSENLALGNADNLAQIMINSAKASTAVSMAVDLTSRAVSSYKEIMQMQI